MSKYYSFWCHFILGFGVSGLVVLGIAGFGAQEAQAQQSPRGEIAGAPERAAEEGQAADPELDVEPFRRLTLPGAIFLQKQQSFTRQCTCRCRGQYVVLSPPEETCPKAEGQECIINGKKGTMKDCGFRWTEFRL